MLFKSIFLSLATVFSVGHAANILLLLQFGSMSHQITFTPLARELGLRGHTVTFFSPYGPKEPPKEYKHLAPPALAEYMSQRLRHMDVVADRYSSGFAKIMLEMPTIVIEACEVLLSTEEFQRFVRQEVKVDLVIIDPLAGECGLGLAQHLKIPYAYFYTAGLYPYASAPLGMPPTATYKSGFLTPGYTDVRKFWHRLLFALDERFFTLSRSYYSFPALERLWEKQLGTPVTSLEEFEKNVSLVLTNAHPLLELPVPVTPNVIDVGGIHLKPNKPLPADLKKLADQKDFILFSLGSAVSVRNIPNELYKSIVETFKKLKENVIWKCDIEPEKLAGLPPNVHVSKWLPQTDILAHPNCKLFITHGGKLSTTESINYGVPMIVIPFFADQDIHAYLAEKNGFGLGLEIYNLNVKSFHSKIRTIMDNPSFGKRAKELMVEMHDQLEPPLKRAVYWVEYVLRHDGATHLRPYARHLTWWQYHLVDVWLFILGIMTLLLVIIVYIIRKLRRLCCGGGNKTKRD